MCTVSDCDCAGRMRAEEYWLAQPGVEHMSSQVLLLTVVYLGACAQRGTGWRSLAWSTGPTTFPAVILTMM